jgi:transcriptional regulator with XRE-family HTH domain
MPVSDMNTKSIEELQSTLGERLKDLRISRNYSQQQLADKAGVSLKTLRNLELGHGSSTETLLRTLKALQTVEALDMLVPKPTISPLAMLQNSKPAQRVRRSLRQR